MTEQEAYRMDAALTQAGYWCYTMFSEAHGYWVVVVRGKLEGV